MGFRHILCTSGGIPIRTSASGALPRCAEQCVQTLGPLRLVAQEQRKAKLFRGGDLLRAYKQAKHQRQQSASGACALSPSTPRVEKEPYCTNRHDGMLLMWALVDEGRDEPDEGGVFPFF